MSISNRKGYKKCLYLIENSIRNVYIQSKSLYVIEMSICNRKIYTKSIDLIKKSIRNVYISSKSLYEKSVSCES